MLRPAWSPKAAVGFQDKKFATFASGPKARLGNQRAVYKGEIYEVSSDFKICGSGREWALVVVGGAHRCLGQMSHFAELHGTKLPERTERVWQRTNAGCGHVLRLTTAWTDHVPGRPGSTPRSRCTACSRPRSHFQFTHAVLRSGRRYCFCDSEFDPLRIRCAWLIRRSGGAIGYGRSGPVVTLAPRRGIPNSLAIEFDTYQNGWDPRCKPCGSHVAIQSCGTGAEHSQVHTAGAAVTTRSRLAPLGVT